MGHMRGDNQLLYSKPAPHTLPTFNNRIWGNGVYPLPFINQFFFSKPKQHHFWSLTVERRKYIVTLLIMFDDALTRNLSIKTCFDVIQVIG